MDVANAIRDQNLDAPAGQVGQPPAPKGQSVQLPIDTLGRLREPEQFADIIVKADPGRLPRSRASSAGPTAPQGGGGMPTPGIGGSMPGTGTGGGTTGSMTGGTSGGTTGGT